MNSRFGRGKGGISGSMGRSSAQRKSDRDRKLFVAAALLAMSLILILVVLFKYKVAAKQEAAPQETSESELAANSLATVTLLAPERPITAGTKLGDVKFRTMYWPRNQVPEGAIRNIEEVRDKFARVDLAAGAPLEREMLTDQPTRSALPVTKGNRAVTISISAESAIEYHVLPGTSVDVVLTHYEGRDVKSKVIVQKARVLSLGGSTDKNRESEGGGRRRLNSQTVTLDVSPKDALEVIAAKHLGKLSLLLRDQSDDQPISTEEVNSADVTDNESSKPVQIKPKKEKCVGGRVKIEGDEFVVGCDGKIFKSE